MPLKFLVIGHSHTIALEHSYRDLSKQGLVNFEMQFLLLRKEEFQLIKGEKWRTGSVSGIDKPSVRKAISEAKADAVVLNLNGTNHFSFGLFRDEAMQHDEKIRRLKAKVRSALTEWLDFLMPELPGPVVLLFAPPPIESQEHIRPIGKGVGKVEVNAEPANFRLELWLKESEVVKAIGKERGMPVVDLPETVFNSAGFRAEDCWGADAAHANIEYGKRVIPVVARTLEQMLDDGVKNAVAEAKPTVQRRNHPYASLPDHCFWKQSISELDPSDVDPVTSPRFKISPKDRVATAGSCFAQHISKRLRDNGFNFFVTEKAEGGEADIQARGFYDFSARYGNVYTARQLLQLFDRAFGYFKPIERVWQRNGGGYCDPFRPRIEPAGFASEEAVIKDGRHHFAAVRRMFQGLDVFVFTLGLTECWISRLDGAAYPMAPGVAGGEYDPEKHAFVNFSVADVVADLRSFLAKLKLVNPKARVILTVSPVPLMATAEDRHVLVSTTYSKSVLRVAAEEIVNSHDNVYYFPSYEIITGQHIGNAYYGQDRRSVTESGVDHVMGVFMSRLTESGAADKSARAPKAERLLAEMEALAEAACDEEMLAR